MTRIIWQFIKDTADSSLSLDIDLNINVLGMESAMRTDDQVTIDASQLRSGNMVSGNKVCDPLQPDEDVVLKNLGLKKMWRSPNGNHSRNILGGVVFREPESFVKNVRAWAGCRLDTPMVDWPSCLG